LSQFPILAKRRYTLPALLLLGYRNPPLRPGLLSALIHAPKLAAIGACRQDVVQISLTEFSVFLQTGALSASGFYLSTRTHRMVEKSGHQIPDFCSATWGQRYGF
jgi:hypothetical protein